MLIVQKYGGSSLATTEKIRFVAEKIVERKQAGNQLIVIVSAMGKTTDSLINLAKEIHSSPPDREMDLLLSTGELVSVALLCMAVENLGESAEGMTGYFAGIQTDNFHTKACIQQIEPSRVIKELNNGNIVIIAGFQGISSENTITTLGRGGSDLTAIAIASAVKAHLCETYTDVEGIFTADPKIVPEAKLIPEISYNELLEMASTGAKVMQSRAVEFAKRYDVPFAVKSTFGKEGGTMVKEISLKEGADVSSVSLDEKQAKITILKVPDTPGIAAKIFSALGKENINVDVIVQNISKENFTDISFTVNIVEVEKTMKIAKAITKELNAAEVIHDTEIAKVSIIGIGMMNHPGVAGRMFETLAKENINIKMISTSEIKISCVVSKSDGTKALKSLHKEFIQ